MKHKSHYTFESVIDSWGAQTVYIFVMAGLIAEVLFLLSFACSTVLWVEHSWKQIVLSRYIKTHGSVLCGQESWRPHCEYIYRKKENSFFTHT